MSGSEETLPPPGEGAVREKGAASDSTIESRGDAFDARGSTASGTGEPRRLDCSALPRDRIGPYRLERELARGGMGAVFRATHTELDRPVALKVLLAGGMASETQRERFRLEAQATARLRHPNVVAIHDVGEEGGIPYLVMDLVEGRSLDDRLEAEGPLPPREAAQVAQKIAEALQAAHERSILHRDVKPANILVSDAGVPLLTDFGLAKLQDSALTGPTLSGQFLGTPAFMSPEQCQGGPVDVRTDVYGLGATLYTLLTGEPPLDRASMMELIAAIMSTEPEPPRSRRQEVPRPLEVIVLKCLEKEPGHRYRTAGALAEDLARFLRGDSILAQPPGVVRRELDALRQNRKTSRITNVAVVALALALLFHLYRIQSYASYELLLAELDSRRPALRASAARGLEGHPGPNGIALLVEALRADESAEVRSAALETLEAVVPKVEKNSRSVVQGLLMVLEQERPAEERARVWALARVAAARLSSPPPQSADLEAWKRWLPTARTDASGS